MEALLISADEIKKILPNYSPEKAEAFHSQSAKQADKEFEAALRENRYKTVILMSGGSASGKTEFLASHLMKGRSIIFDTTLSTPEGPKNKIRKILKANKTPVIYSVVPDDLTRAFIAFLHRDRKFSDAHFYRTHSGSRKTLLWIAENYPQVNIYLIKSSYSRNRKLRFTRLQFNSQ